MYGILFSAQITAVFASFGVGLYPVFNYVTSILFVKTARQGGFCI